MSVIRNGNKRFVAGDRLTPNQSLDRLKNIAAKQTPFAAFLSCADSRVPVEILFDQGFGDIFVTRVAGNVVTTEIIASLEFGCAVLGAKVLYVLGHTKCGAVSATQAGASVPGVISSLYYHLQPACDKCPHDVDEAVKENVLHQVRQLMISPVIRDLVKTGKLRVVGGVYDLQTGLVTEVC
jgi:carbonic anhydrase